MTRPTLYSSSRAKAAKTAAAPAQIRFMSASSLGRLRTIPDVPKLAKRRERAVSPALIPG